MKQLNREELITLIEDALKCKCTSNGKFHAMCTYEDVSIWVAEALLDRNDTNGVNVLQFDPKQTNLLDQIKEVEGMNFDHDDAVKFAKHAVKSINVDTNKFDLLTPANDSKPILKIKLTTPISHCATTDEINDWIDFTPYYGSTLAAAMDCRADLKTANGLIANDNGGYDLQSGKRVTIPLGFSCATPKGYKLSIKPRSGLANKQGLTIVNSPGTVDEDYRGVVMAILLNTGNETITINHGDRICQAELERYEQCTCEVVDELPKTERGEGGLGSTGIK